VFTAGQEDANLTSQTVAEEIKLIESITNVNIKIKLIQPLFLSIIII
jgi:hypothetical protein